MQILFIDESGTPPGKNKCVGQYLVIGGLIIPHETWHGVARDFAKIKGKYSVTREIKWKHFGQTKDDGKNAFCHLTQEQKNEFRLEIFKLITSRRALKVISCVTSCESAYRLKSINSPDDVYHLTYKGVTERFQYFLQDMSKEVGSLQFGMVISDHRMNVDDEKLRKHHHELVEDSGKTSSKYANLIESIQFAPSHFSVGLQLAAMVAGSVHRYFQASDKRFVRLLLPAFRKSPTGIVEGYGLVKMPKTSFMEPSGGEADASPAR